MSLTQAQVQAIINADVTTNGKNENTGARVAAALTALNQATFQGFPWVSVTSLPGVAADGVTNDTVALQSNINSLSATGAVIVFPAGVFCVVGGAAGEVHLKSNVYFLGLGPISGFKQLTPENTNIFVGASIVNSGFENLAIYGADAAGSSYPNAAAISYVTSTNWFVRNNTFYNEPTYGVAYYGGSNFAIDGNNFNLTTATGTYQNEAVLGANGYAPKTFSVSNNIINNTGMLLFGGDASIDGNKIFNCGYGTAIGSAGTQTGLNITNNIADGSLLVLDANGVMPGGIEAAAPSSIVAFNIIKNMGGNGIVVFGGGCVVNSNICVDNGQAGNSSFASGIVAAYASSSSNASGGVFSANISGNSGVGATQLYGYGEYDGGSGHLTNIQLIGNNFANNATARTNIMSSSTTELSAQGTTLPSSDPHVVGVLWNNSGVITISAG